MYVYVLSHVQLFVTPWTVACQASLSTGFFRQEYWSGLPFPPPGDLPHPGIEPISPALAGGFFTTATREAQKELNICMCMYIYIHTHTHTQYMNLLTFFGVLQRPWVQGMRSLNEEVSEIRAWFVFGRDG